MKLQFKAPLITRIDGTHEDFIGTELENEDFFIEVSNTLKTSDRTKLIKDNALDEDGKIDGIKLQKINFMSFVKSHDLEIPNDDNEIITDYTESVDAMYETPMFPMPQIRETILKAIQQLEGIATEKKSKPEALTNNTEDGTPTAEVVA